MISKAERRLGEILPAYKYIRLGKTISKDSRVKVIGGPFQVGATGTVTGFKGLGKVWVQLDHGEVQSLDSMKRALRTLDAIADLRLKPPERHSAVTQAFDNLRYKQKEGNSVETKHEGPSAD